MPINCYVCLTLDAFDLDRVAEGYKAHTSVESLAAQFRQNAETMAEHCTVCLSKAPKSKFDRLGELIDQLTEDAIDARANWANEPTDKDVATIYTNIVKELRANIETASSLVKPEEAAEEIVTEVLEPLIRDLVLACATEIGRLRDELVKAGLPEQQVTTVSKARLLGLSQALKTGLTSSVQKINGLYGSNVQAKVKTAEAVLAKVPVNN